jgi:hypothetical protein
MRRIFWTGLLVSGLLVTGCRLVMDDECKPGDEKCDGSRLVTCDFDSGDARFKWSGAECQSGKCVETAPGDDSNIAYCTLGADPVPNCAGLEPLERACDGNYLVQCIQGYSVYEIEECVSAGLCHPEVPACTVFPDKDPVCESEDPRSDVLICSGQWAVACMEGYRMFQVDCTAENLCYAFDEDRSIPQPETVRTATCILSDQADARCEQLISQEPGDDIQWRRDCFGNFLVTCVNEFLVEDADCGEDTCTNASCQ